MIALFERAKASLAALRARRRARRLEKLEQSLARHGPDRFPGGAGAGGGHEGPAMSRYDGGGG